MIFFKKLKRLCEVREDENLTLYSSMHIKNKVKIMCLPKNKKQLVKLLKYLHLNNKKYYILGNGTNVLFSDEYYDAIFISLKKYNNVKVDGNYIICDSGASINKVNFVAKNNNLFGIEWSYGIPGTIGGAVFMNAGAYGGEICNHINYVLVFDKINTKVMKLKNKQINWGYRYSTFQMGDYVILQVGLKLKTANGEYIEYLQQEYLKKRKETQPLGTYNLGSIFKKIKNVSAGKIIDDLGLKGFSVNDAYVSKIHANFIINQGNATSKDIKSLIQIIQDKAKNELSINLEKEIIYLENSYFNDD